MKRSAMHHLLLLGNAPKNPKHLTPCSNPYNHASALKFPSPCSLPRSNPRHIVMFAQITQISIQIFDALFMRLGTFALETFVKL